jgi:hypothetical protein
VPGRRNPFRLARTLVSGGLDMWKNFGDEWLLDEVLIVNGCRMIKG